MRIRRNDQVIVISGKEKGKTGKVLSVLLEENRAVVEKLNMVKRHQRPTAKMKQGGIVEKELSIHLSNLLLYCSRCSKGVRVRIKTDDKGGKTRRCARCQEAFAA
ncbi:MAG: 50S ribosomal protein L24 [Deltaproteobacteria bacterium]|nr:50S ribosomal protein L24 [Deltaproteobacteria bacterium]MBI2500802.1 50S ribosomal protein L24 [Deltaproteobacteria bacterium]MBI4196468.1 50S ribosomal protein L24 [Deltaproteobacteria bacterium]